MSKQKEDERAPAAAGPPPRLGDHSSNMPEPLLPLADVQIKVEGGFTLLAHALKLVETCGALARSSELFAGASAERPAALSAPFDENAEAVVVRILVHLRRSGRRAGGRGRGAAGGCAPRTRA
jgi:hypothetical protein